MEDKYVTKIEWYHQTRIITFMKLYYSNGNTFSVGTLPYGDKIVFEAGQNDCFTQIEDNFGTENSFFRSIAAKTYRGESFGWKHSINAAMNTYDFEGGCLTGIFGPFSGSYIESLGYAYEPEVKPADPIVRYAKLTVMITAAIIVLTQIFYGCIWLFWSSEDDSQLPEDPEMTKIMQLHRQKIDKMTMQQAS